MRDVSPTTGVVVIGRDLGARLALCLHSVVGQGRPVVYVDSASSDRSEHAAIELGADLVRLDARTPLNASRGRNAGVTRLLETQPESEFVQFVDGDCEIEPGWIDAAVDAMRGNPTLGVVCGHVREKHAERSVAATLLDVDWRGPVGEVTACGGIFLVRAEAFAQAGGFSTELATGEEAELCARLRARGWRIARLDRPMCTHDADMHTLGAWWRRAVRVGSTYARSAALRGDSRDPAAARRIRSVLFWAAVVPLVLLTSLVAGWAWRPEAFLVSAGAVVLCILQVLRLAFRQRRAGGSLRVALLYGTFSFVAKGAHLQGALKYWAGR